MSDAARVAEIHAAESARARAVFAEQARASSAAIQEQREKAAAAEAADAAKADERKAPKGIDLDEDASTIAADEPRIIHVTNSHTEAVTITPKSGGKPQIVYRNLPDHRQARETIDARFVVLCSTLLVQVEKTPSPEADRPNDFASDKGRLRGEPIPDTAYSLPGTPDSVRKMIQYLKTHKGKAPYTPPKPMKSKSLRECGFSKEDADFANSLWSIDKELNEGDFSHRPLFADLWRAANKAIIPTLSALLAWKFASIYKGNPATRIGAVCYSGHENPGLAGNTAEWHRWYMAYKASHAGTSAGSADGGGGGGGGRPDDESGSGGPQKRIKHEASDTKRGDVKAPYAAAAAASATPMYEKDDPVTDFKGRTVAPSGRAASSSAAAAAAPAHARIVRGEDTPMSAAGLPVSATSLRSASSKK